MTQLLTYMREPNLHHKKVGSKPAASKKIIKLNCWCDMQCLFVTLNAQLEPRWLVPTDNE